MPTASPTTLTDLLHQVRAAYRLVHVDETQSVLLLYLERLLRATGCEVLRLRQLSSMVELVVALRPKAAPDEADERIVAMEYAGGGSAARLLEVGAELHATDLWELGWDQVPPAERSGKDRIDPDRTQPFSVQQSIRRRSLREAVYQEAAPALSHMLRGLCADWAADPASAAYLELLLRGDDPDPRPVEAEPALRRWLEARAQPRGQFSNGSNGSSGTPSAGTPRSRVGENDRPIFLLVGAPGSGKTTLLRHFAAMIAREHLDEADAGTRLPATRVPILLSPPEPRRGSPAEATDLDRLLEGAVPGISGKLVRLLVELGLCVLLIDGALAAETLGRLLQPTLVAGCPPKLLLCATARYFVQGRGEIRTNRLIDAAMRSGWDLGYLDPLDDERVGRFLQIRVVDPVLRSAALSQMARSDNLRRLCRRIGLLAALTGDPIVLGAGVAQGEAAPPLLTLHRVLSPVWLEGIAGDRRIERTAREAVAQVLARRLLLAHGEPVPWWELIPELGAALPAEPDGARLILHVLRCLDDTMFVVEYDGDRAAPRLRFALPSAADYFTGEDIASRLTQVSVQHVTACLQRGHHGPVRAVALSGHGRLCMSGGEDRTVRLWDVGSGFLLRALHGHHDAVTAVCFAGPEARLMVSASRDFTARLWETGSGRLVRTLVGHTDAIIALGHAPQRDLLSTASLDGSVRIWEAGSGRCLRTLHPPGARLTAAALSPDGLFCAVGSDDGLLHVFHTLSGELLTVLGGHLGGVLALCLSPDGRLLASGGADGVIRLSDYKGGRLIQSILGHQGAVRSIAFAPGGRSLVSCGDDRTLRVFALPGPGENSPARLLHCRQGQDGWAHGRVYAVAFVALPDGRKGGAKVTGQMGSASPVGSAGSPGPDPLPRLAVASDDAVLLWDTPTVEGPPLRVLDGASAIAGLAGGGGGDGNRARAALGVTALAVSPDGELVAAGGSDGAVRLWDAQKGCLLRDLLGHEGAILAAAFSPDGRILATGSADQSVRLWDRYRGEEIDSFEGHFSDVTALAFSPDGYLLASGSDDQTVRVREVGGGMTLHTFAHDGPVTQVLFTPDGRHVISAAQGGIRVWATAGGPSVQTLKKHLGRVWALALSPDGKLLASAGDDQVVRIWDAGSGRSMHALLAHLDPVCALAFSPDGRVLASVGEDRAVRLWEARSGRAMQSLPGAGALGSVAFLLDGRLIAGGDEGLTLFDASEGRVLGQLHALGEGWLTLCPVLARSAEGPAGSGLPGPVSHVLFAADPEMPASLRMSDLLLSYPCAGWARLCLRPQGVEQTLAGRPYASLAALQQELLANPVPMAVLESSGSRASPMPPAVFLGGLGGLGWTGHGGQARAGSGRSGRMFTADQLLAAESPARGELVHGELVSLSPTTYAPGRVSGRLHGFLVMHVFGKNLGDLPSSDTGYLLQRDPDVVRAPDVSFVARDRVPQGGTAGFFTGAPDLAVEVVAPANEWEDVVRKAQEYLSTGARLVWIVDPQTRTVHVHESPVRVRILGEADALTGGTVLPGFSVPVRDLFS